MPCVSLLAGTTAPKVVLTMHCFFGSTWFKRPVGVESMIIATRRPHLCDVCITFPVYRVYRLVLYTLRLSSYSLTALGSVVLVQQLACYVYYV